MTHRHTAEELRALLTLGDVDAVVLALTTHHDLEGAIYGILPELHATPTIAAAIARGLTGYHRLVIERWLARTPFDGITTVAQFCALATERARLLDPTFPPFREDLLVERYGYCSTTGTYALDDGARGGSLFVESRDRGPAEVIHEEEWIATYWGPGFARRLCYLDTSSAPRSCFEERTAQGTAGAVPTATVSPVIHRK